VIPVAYGRTAALAGVKQETGGVDPRLAPAAHEFEASLMQELLKPMEKDPLFSGGEGDGGGLMSGDAGAGTWSSLGAQSLARAISDAGGLGIATKMISEVEAEAKATQAGKAPAVRRLP
jgi:Rod binding domain-containing protein